ncbi:hypothetical protein [Parendozoicomonas haliclonae]|uniref:Uncharacterized protein n=1 Tax=Parendozoicomonas haliclonae TaxID=1960125 RepID=A0A1X7AGJ2_9GAMM|nr:hypothetical protein [Parendozoicomonas haliclonae]SMA39327.1 hypothetical protein EHSB41UT_01012 [Parendozoicomonas haliclonae]
MSSRVSSPFKLLNWLLVVLLTAGLSVGALVMAGYTEFGPEDKGELSVNKNVRVILDLQRKISVVEVDQGDVILKAHSADGEAREVKGYCVKSNYAGTAGLRVKAEGNANHFALKHKDGSKLELTVKMVDEISKEKAKHVKPDKDYTISTKDPSYVCAAGSATTSLEFSTNMKTATAKGGQYETLLSVIFFAH